MERKAERKEKEKEVTIKRKKEYRIENNVVFEAVTLFFSFTNVSTNKSMAKQRFV